MKNNKRFLQKTLFLLCLLVLGFALFFSLQVLPLQNENLQNLSKSTRASSVYNNEQAKTTVTASEQEQINANILENWGTPNPEKTIALNGVYTNDNMPPFEYLSGEYWYYLTGDVFFNLKQPLPTFSNATKMHILLNGYSIDGNVYFVLNSSQSALKIYDTLPNQTTEYAKRNAVNKHYYYYNTVSGRYDNYSDKILAGSRDETNLPTFTQNSYIAVEGSRIGANTLSSSYVSALGSNNACYIKAYGDLRLYGVNIIGKQNTYSGSTKNGLIYTDTKSTSSIEMIQCNILGNTLVKSGHSAAVNIFSQGNNRVVGSKIYGNKVNQTSVGVEVGQCKYNDLVLSYSGTPGMLKTLYASNVGALTGAHANGAVYYILGVDFGNQLIDQKITIKNFNTILQNLSNLSGTIELVNNVQLEYNGDSPNLKFAIREKEIYVDSEVEETFRAVKNTTQSDNQLTLNTNAQIDAVAMSGGKLLQNGKVLSNISISAGALEVLAQGVVVGQLNITGGEALIHKSATVEAINCSQGKLTIKDGANVDWNKIQISNQINNQAPQTDSNKFIFIIITVAVLLVAILAIGIILITKKRNTKKKVQ